MNQTAGSDPDTVSLSGHRKVRIKKEKKEKNIFVTLPLKLFRNLKIKKQTNCVFYKH